ncbi:MAG: HlyC/CorC family transporter [Deltaproteobacteria bacterium]|nr:HlyC/CorC family transporter [Deltaproteobacteria bacterium]MBW2050866.1 HlyC/CorC family transporter [Deltaproteobacteria bacterium]MBW2140186.1 HlyC/CorC family transporter [Deltaproteobacteria bacterium]MBW2322687.1 HlyC/CorC family transporter [Deltaproteobacteria bacterium]
MILLLLFFFIVLFVSFICSFSEAILLSLTHSHAALMEKEGFKSGPILVALKERIDRPLAAILTLNTISHTVGAAGVGAQTLHLYGSKWVALSSGILTFFILIFSEIVPKTLGAVYWKQLSSPAAYLIRFLIVIAYPVVVIIEAISKLIASGTVQTKMTREEVIVATEISEDEGELFKREERVIKNLLHLNKIHARDIMTPRAVLFAQQKDKTIGEVIKENTPLQFSRIPIFGEDLDDIVGMVYRFDLLNLFAREQTTKTLETIAHPVHVVPDSKSVAETLDDFIKQREHLFLVVDEYGGTAGLVTLEDTIETLLGVEIVDESDSIEDMQEYARKKWARRRRDEGLYE